jgi:hypothetical protein
MGRITLTALFLVVACASKPQVSETLPPQAPAIHAFPDAGQAPALTIRATPDTAVFRPVLERTLGRAGFRILPQPEPGCLTVNLSGNGSSVSGSNEQGSTVKNTLISELAVFADDGRLRSEHRSEVNYTLFHERESEHESFEQFNRRVNDTLNGAFEFLAADLTNKLIESVQR